MPRKPSAADRTVNMFTGSTNLEAAEQSDVTVEAKDASPEIEANMDRWLQKAIDTQQYLSKKFADSVPNDEAWRLTKAKDTYTLELVGKGADGKAFKWWAFQFHENSLYSLANVIVEASRAKKASDVQKA